MRCHRVLTRVSHVDLLLPSRSNWGIIVGIGIGLAVLYVTASEFISEAKSKGEVKLYPRTRIPKHAKKSDAASDDIESSGPGSPGKIRPEDDEEGVKKDVNIQRQTAIFHWQDLCYDIPVKGGTRRLLDHVDGWVKVRMLLRSTQLAS